MICRKCRSNVPDAPYCCQCGAAQEVHRSKRQRGNGQGTIRPLANGRYQAIVTLGYELTPDGRRLQRRRTKVFDKKKDAVAALATLGKSGSKAYDASRKPMTFAEVYAKWLPMHKAGKDTLNCYKAAYKYFKSIQFLPFRDIDVDDLQECIDSCPKGKRTKENMRACVGLMYKYAIPRHLTEDNLNLSKYLNVDGEGAAHRASFDMDQVQLIREAAECNSVAHADEILCMILTGFRPSEFLALTSESYNAGMKCLTGGAKTDAGKDRLVPVSPVILPLIEERAKRKGPMFPNGGGKQWSLKDFTEKAFYPALDAIGIDNPMVEIGGGVLRHKYTPHSCRHTFATLLKRVKGADKDKLSIIGHTSTEMLMYYQDAPLEDLRKIANQLL